MPIGKLPYTLNITAAPTISSDGTMVQISYQVQDATGTVMGIPQTIGIPTQTASTYNLMEMSKKIILQQLVEDASPDPLGVVNALFSQGYGLTL